MRTILIDILEKIEMHFHAVIAGRAGDLIERNHVDLPDLKLFVQSGAVDAWLPIPGM